MSTQLKLVLKIKQTNLAYSVFAVDNFCQRIHQLFPFVSVPVKIFEKTVVLDLTKITVAYPLSRVHFQQLIY